MFSSRGDPSCSWLLVRRVSIRCCVESCPRKLQSRVALLESYRSALAVYRMWVRHCLTPTTLEHLHCTLLVGLAWRDRTDWYDGIPRYYGEHPDNQRLTVMTAAGVGRLVSCCPHPWRFYRTIRRIKLPAISRHSLTPHLGTTTKGCSRTTGVIACPQDPLLEHGIPGSGDIAGIAGRHPDEPNPQSWKG